MDGKHYSLANIQVVNHVNHTSTSLVKPDLMANDDQFDLDEQRYYCNQLSFDLDDNSTQLQFKHFELSVLEENPKEADWKKFQMIVCTRPNHNHAVEYIVFAILMTIFVTSLGGYYYTIYKNGKKDKKSED